MNFSVTGVQHMMKKQTLLKNGVPILDDVRFIMLDKDGTIVDLHHYWVGMIRKRTEKIIEKWFKDSRESNEIHESLCSAMGIDIAAQKIKPEGPVGIESRQTIIGIVKNEIKKLKINLNGTEEVSSIFSQVDMETKDNLHTLVQEVPGVRQFLTKCKERDIKVSIVSNDIKPRIVASVKTLGLEKYFFNFIGGNQVNQTKPFPDLAVLAMRSAKQNPLKSVIIGDHPVDIKMGINSNVKCNIGVLTGIGTLDSFSGLNCHIIDSLSSLDIDTA